MEEDKVDVIIGSAGAPATLAIASVARETKTPLIAIANADLPGAEGAWMVTLPQPAPLMMSAMVEKMKQAGVKTLAYIGFSDSWGDLVYDALTKSAPAAGIEVVANERYARSASSVAGQVLKIVALRPDAVITGASGTPGALPYLALAERGYKGKIYGMHSLLNPDFIRVGGPSVQGVQVPTGPVVVAEQLPDTHPMKKVALEFRAAYQKSEGAAPPDTFWAYSFDAWTIYLDAAQRALASKAEPGTAQFRLALRDAIVGTREFVRPPSHRAQRHDRLSRPSRSRRSAGAGRPGAPRPVPERGAFRARTTAPVRQHLALPGPREPGARAWRLCRARHRRAAAADGAPARRRSARAVQPLRPQRRAVAHGRERKRGPFFALPLPRMDLQARRRAARAAAENRLRRHAAQSLRVGAGAVGGQTSEAVPRLPLRSSIRYRPLVRGLLRPCSGRHRRHGRALPRRPAQRRRRRAAQHHPLQLEDLPGEHQRHGAPDVDARVGHPCGPGAVGQPRPRRPPADGAGADIAVRLGLRILRRHGRARVRQRPQRVGRELQHPLQLRAVARIRGRAAHRARPGARRRDIAALAAKRGLLSEPVRQRLAAGHPRDPAAGGQPHADRGLEPARGRRAGAAVRARDELQPPRVLADVGGRARRCAPVREHPAGPARRRQRVGQPAPQPRRRRDAAG